MITPCRFPRAAAAVVGLVLTTCAAAAVHAAPPASRPPLTLRAGEFLPTAKLVPGMKGYGLTIFQGTKIEKFDVTILGVMKKVNNGKDLILVRLGGPAMRRVTDVIAGMSGSPVYVNNKLVGAVSYGSTFTREPIGYLTPIEDMLDALDPNLPQPPRDAAPPAAAGAAKTTLPRGLRPLLTPVSVSGVPARRFPALAQALAKLGLRARQTPAGRAALPPGRKGSALVPGGAVGMSLATGDLDITGIGTLTYRRGKQVVAFGHPFMGIGPLDAPMYSAYIHDIEPSFAESNKLGSPVDLVGSFTQDRPFSIGGRIGAQPVMVPVTVSIDDRAFNRRRTFQAKILRHPLLTPLLASLAAGSAIAEVHGQPGDSMATVTTTVEADEVGKITRTNRVYDALAIDEAATGDLSQLLSTLSSNPLYPVGIRRVSLNVTIESGRKTAQVERIFLKQTRFEPGDTVEVGVVLKPFKQNRIVRTIPLRIPANAPLGSLALVVQGGGGVGGGLSSLILGSSRSSSDAAAAVSVKQLVRRYSEREKNNELVARLVLPTSVVTVQGEKLSGLPPAIEAVMRQARSTGLRTERDEVKIVQSTDYVLSGVQALTIRVAKKGQPDRPAYPFPAPGSLLDRTPGGAPPSGAPGSGAPPPSALGEEDEDVATPLSPLRDPKTMGQEPIRIPAAPPPGAPRPPSDEDDEEASKPGALASGERRVRSAAAAAESEATSTASRPVGRLPGVWRQTTAADFRAGTLQGAVVTSLGDVRPAPTFRKIAESTEPYFWSLAESGKSGVFVGSGDNGVVYHVDGKGNRTVWAQTGELEVHALVRSPVDGMLYAGTSPNGRVVRLSERGAPSEAPSKPFFQTKDKYVLALVLDETGDTLYAATGGSGRGRVYKIARATGKGEIVYESTESHVSALAAGPGGVVYAGTTPNGLVVQIAGPGLSKPIVLFDAMETSITGLGVDARSSALYAGASAGTRGVLYRIAPNETTRALYDKAPGALMGLAVDPSAGTVYAASGATVYAVTPGKTVSDEPDVRTFEAPSDIQILSLLRADDGTLFAATGSVGAVYALGGGTTAGLNDKPAEGTLVSSVFDAKSTARWGTVRWTAAVPAGAKVVLQTRSGETAEPDATWSDWSRVYGGASAGETIASPPGRYLQYRATLLDGAGGGGPSLRAVEVFYLTRNQAPVVTLAAPRAGEVWRGTKTLRWTGSDPDKDTLSYEVSLSPDGGKTWKQVPAVKPLRATAPGGENRSGTRADKETDEEKMMAEVRAELDRHPELPDDKKAELLAAAPDAIRQAVAAGAVPPGRSAEAGGAAAAGPTRETSAVLDTTKWPDGNYVARVVASDAAANPDEEGRTERLSSEFRIVNRPPTLILLDKATLVRPDKRARLEGMAMHGLVAVRAVQYRVDNGDWVAAVAQDGLFDGRTENWGATTMPLATGAHTIEVQAQDEAGNTATRKTTLAVP